MDIYGDITSNIDLWGSELDTIQDTLPLSPDADLGDWFPYRNGETKMSQVILNDKLMTDALCIQAPVKVEHSYSLNSDGDSIPESPDGSLDGNKMDDLDADSSCNLGITSFSNDGNNNPKNQKYLQLLSNNNNNNQLNYNLLSSLQNKAVSSAANANLHMLGSQSNDILRNGFSNSTIKSLINGFAGANQGHGNNGTFDTSSSISSMSDIDIEDAHIKEEPLSPNSSCPPSPNSHNNYNSVYYNTSNNASNMNMTPVNLSNMAFAQNDMMYEHKGTALNLTSNTQSLLKNPQLILGSTSAATTSSNRVAMSKANIKIENQMSAFGLPPTPPSSLPSDESEGNQSPEHHLAPMSPPNQTIAAPSAATPSTSKKNSCAQQYSNSNSNSTRGYSNSTRQPIHTPLISSQPKGSTGELILTEEEKRTLLAEGYPIPQRLPLTKAEEKSLKKVRRKIKNKISAQESRRKKKEYMDQLERRVEKLVLENNTYRTRIETLEDENSNIMKELQRLQQMLNRQQASMRKN